MRHIIRKQVFDLWVHKDLDAQELQQRVSDRFWIDILPELDNCFNNISDEENVTRIDRLEIDLGHITEEMIDSGEWAQLFRKKLEEALEESMSDIALSRGVNIIQLSESVFSQWLYFIKHGHLPWNTAKLTDKWFQQVLESIALSYKSSDTLRKLLVGSPVVAERITMHHSSEFLSHLVELLTAERQNNLPTSIIELAAWLDTINIKYSPVTSLARRSIERRIWTKLLQRVAVEESKLDTSNIVTYLLMHWLELTPESLFAIVKHQPVSEQYTIISPIIKGIISDVEKSEHALKHLPHKSSDETIDQHSSKNIRAPSGNDSKKGMQDEQADSGQLQVQLLEQLKRDRTKDSATIEEIATEVQALASKEGIFITQAGLVLLHPFMHNFFKKLNLVKDGKFIDEAKQERAVCLLHELASSNTPMQEYNLVLAKLLCAWPIHRPIDNGIELTIEEKEEAHRLLRAAIEQWEILKSTTPLAFQETFLQREGKLIFNGSWYLHVEKSAVDILLAHLPWMISMIKLPWMKELLKVEWRC